MDVAKLSASVRMSSNLAFFLSGASVPSPSRSESSTTAPVLEDPPSAVALKRTLEVLPRPIKDTKERWHAREASKSTRMLLGSQLLPGLAWNDRVL